MDVYRWPAKRVFNDQTYALAFHASRNDAIQSHASALSDIKPGWGYGAHYSSEVHRDAWVGPSYWWRSDSTLSERSYRAPQAWKIWCYKPNGDLYSYHFWEYDSTGAVRLSGDEWFTSRGNLLACRMGSKHYWMGTETEGSVPLSKRVREAIPWE